MDQLISTLKIDMDKKMKQRNHYTGTWYLKDKKHKKRREKTKSLPQNFASSIRILHLNQQQPSHLI